MNNNFLGTSRGSLNKAELSQWLHNSKKFLLPVAVIYLGSLAVLLQTTGHRFSFADLLPSVAVQGAIALYLVNAAYDFSNKWLSDNRY